MHSYLRAVGFSNLQTRGDLDRVLGHIMNEPTQKGMILLEPNRTFTEIKKDIGDHIGIAIRGEYDEKGFFHLEHYFPYCTGSLVSSKESVIINKRVDTDAYTGMCDDIRLGVSLIFYLQNAIDYLRSKSILNTGRVVNVTMSALSIKGSVLLGIETNIDATQSHSADTKRRNQLIAEARAGSQDAIDNLTIDEIDLYAMVSRRSRNEDVYSIVESSFIPYGSESDNYTILGTIMNWKLVKNTLTNEDVYILLVNCNDLSYSVCINKEDLEGEPMIGRRFKGNVWMQAAVDFTEIN